MPMAIAFVAAQLVFDRFWIDYFSAGFYVDNLQEIRLLPSFENGLQLWAE